MSLAWDEGWEVDRYQEEIERTERERREFGWDVPGGWARPQDPVCKRCWYVLVDGVCVGCKALSERGRVERQAGDVTPAQSVTSDRVAEVPPAPRSESAYGEEAA